MRLRDLGPLVVETDVERLVAGSRVPAILALLLINANRRVSAEALMNAAWGEKVSSGAKSTLESHIWRLRQLLEPDRVSGHAPSVLMNDSGGYRLITTDDNVDSLRLQRLAGEVRDGLAAGEPDRAVRLADEGLALWRGEPFGPFADAEWAAPAVAHITESHDQLQERRIDALLAVGQVDLALVDLQDLIGKSPFREQLWAQRMLALYRSGRAEEALNTYQRVRALLLEEIGVDAGPDLQDLHRRILAQDPSLSLDHSAGHGAPAAAPLEVHLPVRLTQLIGRSDDLTALDELITEGRLITVVGPAGCGKTRLAIEVARLAAGRFPDGVWFVDLTATSGPELVVDVITSTIGIAGSATGTPLQALSAYVRSRRMLLVLDNCEHVLDEVATVVEAVLGDSADPVVLTTSREPVDVAGELLWSVGPLKLPEPGSTDDPARAPAVELFLQRLHAAAPTVRLDLDAVRISAAICRAVDGVPLAIELAAARARSTDLAEIFSQVAADPSGLSRIGRRAADHHQSVRSGIEWSYRMLSPAEQRLHRRLSVLPGAFPRSAAAAVSGTPSSHDPTDDVLQQLVHRSLLAPVAARRPGAPSMFSQLVTVRGHAQHALIAAGERHDTQRRRDQWVAGLIATRPALGRPEHAAWSQAIEDAYPTVREALQHNLIDNSGETPIRVAPLFVYWFYRTQLTEGERWLQLAVDHAAGSSPDLLAEALLALASALALRGRPDLARPHIEHALRVLDGSPPLSLPQIADFLLTAGNALWARAELELATQVNIRAAAIAAATGNPDLRVLAEAQRCLIGLAASDLTASARRAQLLYDRAVELDNLQAIWQTAGLQMLIAMATRQPVQGKQWADRAIHAYYRLGANGAGPFVEARANFEAMSGDPAKAVLLYAAAQAQMRRSGQTWPQHDITNQLLEGLQHSVPRLTYEQAWSAGRRLTVDDLVRIGSDEAPLRDQAKTSAT